MVLTTSKQLSKVSPNLIREFDSKISQIEGILKFTLGEPDFDTPEIAKAAAVKAIQENHSYYSPSAGLPELRHQISAFMKRKYQLDYDENNEILVTVGATEGIAIAAVGLLDPGDQVLIPSPFFSLYTNAIVAAYGEPIYINTAQDNFKLTPEKLRESLEANPKTKALFLNYPCNPTGVTYTREELKDLAEVIKAFEIYCVADEIYGELVYDGVKHSSIAEFIPEQTIILNGASKSYAMTGYRIGFMAFPKALYEPFFISHQVNVTCATTPEQFAAIAAFEHGDADIERMRAAYDERRHYLVTELSKLGFQMASPKGAFYLFLKIPNNYTQDDFAFALELAENAKVGLIPGSTFGPGGEGYVRMSYAASMHDLEEGVRRLSAYMKVE